ncbi:helix-turn-helix domain-containing protein [Solicola gregarius]|uniref:XRE family transcriptional regulator n=1 Tax=Solicola gregarius TaxID=2908642 RepID=A0AA46YPJ6_9ACTN|nr:XRE family transcriptional regulator [Solicola gregarius]UYM07678.1 XRE family transcriptional regulator [Solicola gregarius]
MNPVRRLRQAAGLSQHELAERSGVAQPNIAAYETGRRAPSKAMLHRLSEACRPTPHDALAAHRDDLLALAERFGLTDVRVFGSALRRTDGPGSDLDIVVTAAPTVGLLGLAGFSREAGDLLGVEVDVVTDGGMQPDHEVLLTAVAI